MSPPWGWPLVVKGIFEIIQEINKQGSPCCSRAERQHGPLKIADLGYVLRPAASLFTGSGGTC